MKEAFERGFMKAAMAHGVEPLMAVELLKYAAPSMTQLSNDRTSPEDMYSPPLPRESSERLPSLFPTRKRVTNRELINFKDLSIGSEADKMKGSYSAAAAAAAGAPAAQASPNPLAKYLTPEGLAMIGGGAALGGGAGALLGGGEHRGRNAAIGALLGGGAGAGADYLHANPEMYKSLLGGQ